MFPHWENSVFYGRKHYFLREKTQFSHKENNSAASFIATNSFAATCHHAATTQFCP